MKIYLAIKFHFDNQNRPLIERLISHFQKQGHSVTCAVRDFEHWSAKAYDPQELLYKAFKAIEGSDLVLVEATEKGMGVGIEAGFSYARNIPIITIARDDSDISINLRSRSKKIVTDSEVEEIELNDMFN